MKYYNFDIVFAEVPDETTLAVNITNCPNHCIGCHSPHLQQDIGEKLDAASLSAILDRYGRSITCLCFMGGDAEPFEVAALARVIRENRPELKLAWYSGRSELPEGLQLQRYDYIKLGGYQASAGPLNSPTTNQRFYKVQLDGTMEDCTELFWRKRF